MYRDLKEIFKIYTGNNELNAINIDGVPSKDEAFNIIKSDLAKFFDLEDNAFLSPKAQVSGLLYFVRLAYSFFLAQQNKEGKDVWELQNKEDILGLIDDLTIKIRETMPNLNE